MELYIAATLTILCILGLMFCVVRCADMWGAERWGFYCIPFLIGTVVFGNWWLYLHQCVGGVCP